MARPNVTVTVVDNSFIVPGSEGGSPHASGMLSLTTPSLVELFGTTLDKDNNYMTLSSLGEWVTLLNGTTYGGVTGSGPTGDWKTDWYSAYNYLSYGGILRIAEDETTFYDSTIPLDTIFTSSLTQTQLTKVELVRDQREDIIAIVGVTYEGYTGGTVPSTPTLYPDPTASERSFVVGGEKVMLGLSNQTVATNFVDVPLASDVAGCFARTDRVTQPWFSPAGTTRGRILNVVRLKKNPNNTEQDNLYALDVNPVIGVPGEGTFLFGDKTKESDDTSTLTRVNVVRLINYIKRILGNAARGVLFEVNDETTRSQFRNAANGFLQTILEGRGLVEYKVVCDETNNPGIVVDANQFVADIFIKPTKSINFVRIIITNVNTDVEL